VHGVKAWVVGHTYVTALAHGKFRALAALGDVDLTVLVPTAWRTALGMLPLAVPSATGYRIVPSRLLVNGRIGAYLYRDGLVALRRARPDVVQAEVEPWSLAALQCVLAAGRSPVVVHTWENLEGPRRLASRVVERIVLRRVAFVLAGNRGARARMLRRGVPPHRIAVMPQYGVDPDRYAIADGSRVRGRFALAPPVVGFVGRVVDEKAVDVLVAACAGLDVRLLLVGDGAARPRLERATAGWPAGKVTFAGAVTDADVPDHLATMDVLVLPSRTTASWAEQFGHVLIEAMAAGVPVVGSSSGAIPEVIGDAGLIFPEDDHEVLAAQLQRLLADGGLRKSLAERGRERVRRHYTHEVLAREHRDIWAGLLRS
jgi:glycosyltransferase involved in cell wall biosynthesis